MRNTVKKVFTALLAAVLCLSLAGCYSENKTWSAKKGDDTLPIGAYIFYLNSAYSEARGKVSTETDVLEGQIKYEKTGETLDGKTWVENRALDYVRAYYYVNDKFDELGLEFTEEDKSDAQTNTDSMWSYYKTTMEDLGIAKESYHLAFTVYNAKYQRVMEAMYGEGGEFEVSQDELKDYFTENYYSYEYFYAPLTKTDDDGNSVNLSDEEKEEVKSRLEAYVTKVNAGETTLEEAASQYAEESSDSADSTTYQAPSPVLKENLTDESIKDALKNGEDDKAALVESSTNYYVVLKHNIADKFTETVEDETQKTSVIANMKGEEFAEYVTEQEVEGLEFNETALNSVKLSKIRTDDNKSGTSSVASDDESDTDSSSAAESSAVESSQAESSQTESSQAE